METFTVVAVIDGNTFEVSPPWEWKDETGDRVTATGYDAPRSGKQGMAAEQKLSVLIQNKKVELGTPLKIEGGRLVCEVYFQGMNLADYFSEYKE
jgi:endonuclease YncB( thermonuclease family)